MSRSSRHNPTSPPGSATPYAAYVGSSSAAGVGAPQPRSGRHQHHPPHLPLLLDKRTGLDEELADDHPEYYLTAAQRERLAHDAALSEYDKMIIQRLACRKFYVPGHTFWEDYCYWFSNNHPFLCFCLADPRHPLGHNERVMNLLSSLAFGLAATCSVVLWFQSEPDRNFDQIVVSLFGLYDVTVGMLALLLFSGPLHVVFDLGLYFIQACPPCRPGGLFDRWGWPAAHQKFWLWAGAHMAFLITIASLSLAITVMLLRASIADDGDGGDIATRPECYSFMLLYMLEVVVANFIVFPIGTFTMFSGVLGCFGKVPVIGGRPYQVRKHQAMLEKKKAREKATMV